MLRRLIIKVSGLRPIERLALFLTFAIYSTIFYSLVALIMAIDRRMEITCQCHDCPKTQADLNAANFTRPR